MTKRTEELRESAIVSAVYSFGAYEDSAEEVGDPEGQPIVETYPELRAAVEGAVDAVLAIDPLTPEQREVVDRLDNPYWRIESEKTGTCGAYVVKDDNFVAFYTIYPNGACVVERLQGLGQGWSEEDLDGVPVETDYEKGVYCYADDAKLPKSLEGRRVRLLRPMHDLWSNLGPGAEGTVTHVDDAGTVHVQWDDGPNLGILNDIDSWGVIIYDPEEEKD